MPRHIQIIKMAGAVLICSLSILLVQLIAGNITKVSAAPPGCYNFNTSSGVFSSVACANPAMSAGVASGNCFLSYTSGAGTTPLEGADCDSITLPATPTPPPVGTTFGTVDKNDCNDAVLTSDNCRIIDLILTFINGLSALVAVVVVAVIVVAGIQYSASADDPKAVSEAKNRIKNALVALLAYIFMFAFLQWVVPGGIF